MKRIPDKLWLDRYAEDSREHSVSRKIRNSLYQEGVEYYCEDCGKPIYLKRDGGRSDKHILILHHIIPVLRGGKSEPSNLVALCNNCHRMRHNKINEKIELPLLWVNYNTKKVN